MLNLLFCGYAQFTVLKDTVWVDLKENTRNEGYQEVIGSLSGSVDLNYELVSETATSKTGWKLEFCDCIECKVGFAPSGSCTIDPGTNLKFIFYCDPLKNIDTAYVTYKLTNANDANDTAFFTWATRAVPLSMENVKSDHLKLSVFPNPTAGMINVSMGNTFSEEFTVSVINTLGVEVYSSLISFDSTISTEQSIDLSKFEKGVYFLTLSNGSDVYTERVSLK